MEFNGYMPVRVISGRGCLNGAEDIFRSFGDSCLLVCSGSAAKKSGALADCERTLSAAGVRYTVFDRIGQNPLTTTCREAGAAARKCGASFIVGIGGGSPMDAAKAVAIYACNPEMGHADIYKREVPARALPVVLIGTTAGTGSEVTGVSVLTNADTGLKKSISGADCYAAVSFCDYRYSCSAPASVTLSTALDAFAHAVESLLCDTSNDLSETYALRAISLLSAFIRRLPCDDVAEKELPDDAQREVLYAASIYAGLAINITGTAFPHTVGYVLTENYGVPHGIACAAFMPELLMRAEKNCPEKIGAITKTLGVDSETLRDKIFKAVRIPFGISEDEARAYVRRWEGGVRNFDRSPGGFTADDAARLLVARTEL